jgi:GntR family transcriptional regulator
MFICINVLTYFDNGVYCKQEFLVREIAVMATLTQNGVPFYHQLKEIFIEKIENGEWRPGETIPPENQLCDLYNVSRGPVRQALDILVRDGLLSRKQGKGTVVLPPKIEKGLGAFYSFTTLIEQKGMRASTQLLSFDTVPAQGSVTRYLEIQSGEPLFKVRRLRLANDEPLILEVIYIPTRVCSSLTAERMLSTPLYTILSTCYGISLIRAKQFFEPVVTDEYEAQKLDIPNGAPALLIQNITYSADNRPIVLSKAIMRGDRVRYYVELSAQINVP